MFGRQGKFWTHNRDSESVGSQFDSESVGGFARTVANATVRSLANFE
jgi:hypothetical protein